jgi:hypothetical protein
MAVLSRTRLQETKPPDKAEHHASAAKQTAALSKSASKLPSPAVAAEILDAAERNVRRPLTPPPSRPKTAPAPLSSEKSPARPQIAPAAPPPAAVVVQQPLPLVTRSLQAVSQDARTRPAPVLTIVPKTSGAAPGVPQTQSVAPTALVQSPAAAAPAAPPPAVARKAAAPEAEAAPAAPAEQGKEEPAKDAKGKEPEKEKGKEAGKEAKGATAEGGPEGEEGAGGAAAPAVKLHMPEPPSEPSPATKKRIHGVKARAGAAAGAHAALPPGAAQVADARQSVTEPDAEAKAKAQADLIAMLDDKPAPSPEIVKLCERIRDVIRNKRPPDEDALMEAKPEGEALNAGNQLNATVEGETKKVQDNYGALNAPPAGAAPQKGQELPPQPDAAGTPGVNARAAAPDAVPAQNVSLDKDAADSKKKMQNAGMDTPAAQLVQSGPVADARGAQGELEQTAKEDPAKVLADQKATLAKAEDDMAALQQQALAALTKSRATTVKGATSQQHGMVGSEESMRAKASADAQQIFNDTQTQVEALLKPVASNAIAEWEAAKDVLVSKFKADLAPVQKRVDDRHAGVGGFFTGLWDAVAGLPSWAEEGYTLAEKNFGDGVIAKLTEISVKVNTVIATCEALIKSARQRISKIFSELPGSLKDWAAQEQAKFDGKLDQLHNHAIAARDSFNKDLVERSSAAVDEVRGEIAELRKKAGGLIGRIENAIRKFIDDPIKFIIEGLLELLGIPPASFWAVVAKIKKVIKDIADDPMKFANNLLAGLAQGFSQFFDNILEHLLKGFISWLTGSLGDVGVQLPKDASLKSIITFFLQLMGITWPRIRKVLAKHVGEKNVALLEKVYSLVSFLIEKGPEGIFEMIKEMLDPQNIVDQVVKLAVDYIITAVVKAVSVRIIMLFNPAGAILQALEAIYKVLKWIFQNAARIFTLIETVVNGVADILAGNIGGFANAVEKGLEMLIAPVISFIADYLGFGDLPDKIAKKIKEFQDWVMSLIEKALVFIIEKGKALLASLGIGKKKKEDEKAGTPHEQAVHEVVSALEEPPPGEPEGYQELRKTKEAEAQKLVAVHNEGLAAEHVKMSVTFQDPSSDQEDHDLDFTVIVAPNNTEEKGAAKVAVPEPIAGPHQVQRKTPPPAEGPEQSHHVPAKALLKGIAALLEDAAGKLEGKDWKDVPQAAVIAKAFRKQAGKNKGRAEVGEKLSAILLSDKAHKGDSGTHSAVNAGKVINSLDNNPAEAKIALVKKQTATQINNVASYVAVNPRTGSWRTFLNDVYESIHDPKFAPRPGAPSTAASAIEVILVKARAEFEQAEATEEAFLQVNVVDATNEVIDEGVGQAYTRGRGAVQSGMESAKFGTPEGRQKALGDLETEFDNSWQEFRDPIVV